MISQNEIYQILNNSRAEKKIVLLDCCRNLQQDENNKTQVQFTQTKGIFKSIGSVPSGFIVLTSCDDGQTSTMDIFEGSTWTQNLVKTNIMNEIIVRDWPTLVEHCRQDGGQIPQWTMNPPQQETRQTTSKSEKRIEQLEERLHNEQLEKRRLQRELTYAQRNSSRNQFREHSQPQLLQPRLRIPIDINIGKGRGGKGKGKGIRIGGGNVIIGIEELVNIVL
jgi:hypothetical protein